MKILIADDERMIRVTIVSMLRDLNFSFKEIREVDNGEKLLNILGQFTPDIAFVDIKMPKLDGLEAINRGKELSPNTKWVILTGFPEFEYAKKAIDLGVSKYLLKPVSPQALEDTILSLKKDKSASIIDLNKRFERDIISIYNKFDSVKELSLESIVKKSTFEAAVIYFDGNNKNSTLVKQKKSFFLDLTQLISSLLSNDVRIALFSISDSEVAMVCAYDITKNLSSEASINRYFFKVSELAERYSDTKLRITLLKSSPFSNYFKLNESFAQIIAFSSTRVLLGTGCIHLIEKLNTLDSCTSYIELSNLLLDLCRYYIDRKYLYLNNSFKQLQKMLSNSMLSVNRDMKINITSFLYCIIDIELQPEDSLTKWLTHLHKQCEKLLRELNDNNIDYINQVIDFMKENYMYDIGVNTLADMLGITPNYLSSIFHKKTNMKFIDYLTELRILKSKELLAEKRLSIKEISEKIGYLSTRHFTKLFFKFEHQYPSDYRKNLK